MPRPPILPTIDWPAVFASGADFDAWIRNAPEDEQANARKMADDRAALALDGPTRGLLTGLPKPVHVVAIAEAWCGDVVRHAPVIQKLADASERLNVRYLTRAQHPDMFARFLTNGGEAIPKFIFLSDRFVECGNWGPMPEAPRRLIARGKACGDGGRARKLVGAAYDADPERREVLAELLDLVTLAAAESV